MIQVVLRDDSPVLGLPPPATLHALAEQNTEELRAEARRFADSRALLVRAAGHSIPKSYAAELVHDAIANTWLGVARWDPTRCTLLVHVRGVIMDRTAKEIRRGRRFSHVPFDVAIRDPIDAEQVELALTPAHGTGLVSSLVLRVVHELRAIAEGDAHAHTLLDCWSQGLVERDEVMAHTGLGRAAYKATRTRLLSYAPKLSQDLRETARVMLGKAS